MGCPIRDIMTPHPECCTAEDSIVEVARIMEEHDVGIVPVVESQESRRAVGVVTDRDIILRVVAAGRDPNRVAGIQEVMSTELICCAPDEDVITVAERMRQHRVHRILVCDEQRSVIGIVTTADLALHSDEAKLGQTMKGIAEP